MCKSIILLHTSAQIARYTGVSHEKVLVTIHLRCKTEIKHIARLLYTPFTSVKLRTPDLISKLIVLQKTFSYH